MSGLGCQTQVIHTAAGDERGPVPCGHLRSHHRDPAGGPCQIGGCGCPTYTPPEDHTPPPTLDDGRVPVKAGEGSKGAKGESNTFTILDEDMPDPDPTPGPG